MKFTIAVSMFLLSSCTTYCIGKFESVKLNERKISNNTSVSGDMILAKPKTVKECSLQIFTFPLVTHNLQSVLGKLCSNGVTASDVEIHEEFWTTLMFGQVCTVVTGRCKHEN